MKYIIYVDTCYVFHYIDDCLNFTLEALDGKFERLLEIYFDLQKLRLQFLYQLVELSFKVIVISFSIFLSSVFSVLFDTSVNVFLMLFVGLNLYDTFVFGLSFCLSHHFTTVLYNLDLLLVLSFHFLLELLSKVFDLILMDLEYVLKL